ncbi:phospholipase A2 inhibitor and Ly6/PLAUR domain-containing protein-like isoform X2 [Muntiacus reevesi]|uniref:phospholipase A2 inhibitor and Ly6/PLAUR domain-containing protein-like isoform X2 n=1 Tax=Muntiacus reevesi TaxID=9886 RepID=UPI0033074204
MKPSMKAATFLLASGLLCTLLGRGNPLSCEVCSSDGSNCSGKLQTCTHDEDTCITILTEAKKEGSLVVTSYKGCAKSSECDSGFLAMTMNPENYMGSTRRCCQDDGCNQDPLPAFVKNHTENGLRCPSCFDTFTETCTSTQDALCVGEETHCVTVTGLARSREGLLKFDVKFAARGCGTENTCHSKPGTLVPSGSHLLTIKKTSCHPSS